MCVIEPDLVARFCLVQSCADRFTADVLTDLRCPEGPPLRCERVGTSLSSSSEHLPRCREIDDEDQYVKSPMARPSRRDTLLHISDRKGGRT